MRVDLDLEPSCLAGLHRSAVREAERCQPLAEGDHLLCKRAAQIRGVATRVESAEVAIQLAFGVANAGFISNDQGSVHRCDGAAAAGLRFNPAQDFVHAFESRDVTEAQLGTIEADGSQTTGLSVPTQVDS